MPRVWGLSDLHLSFARPEPRERFAARWRDHAAKIEEQWRAVVAPEDVILLPGDLSMARNHREVQPDLAWIGRLPGIKVLAAGNHDRWFNDIAQVRPLLRKTTFAVGGDAIAVAGIIACGTRGAPISADGQEHADPELAALDEALKAARALRTASEPIYALWHFPPFDAHRRPGPVVEVLKAGGASACVYGHLHAQGQWSLGVTGEVDGIRYHCVAADAVAFRPLRLDAPAQRPRR